MGTTTFHSKANSSEQESLDSEQRRNFLGSIQRNLPAQVPSAEFLQLQSLCPFSRAARSGFVLCHQTPPGKLGAALTESYDGRASQHQRNSNRGVLKPSRTLVSYLFIFICKSTHSNHRLLHSSGLPTRPQPPAPCLFLLQPQLGFVGISKSGSESPRPTGSSTHLLRSCVHPLPQSNSWESSHEQHPFCTLPLGGGRQEKSPESSL